MISAHSKGAVDYVFSDGVLFLIRPDMELQKIRDNFPDHIKDCQQAVDHHLEELQKAVEREAANREREQQLRDRNRI